jgi:multiple sugar transport system ATP-binding protein
LQRQLGTTTLYLTHDQVEAMTMGHRIAVLNTGRLQQLGTPMELYQWPAAAWRGQRRPAPLGAGIEGVVAGRLARAIRAHLVGGPAVIGHPRSWPLASI